MSSPPGTSVESMTITSRLSYMIVRGVAEYRIGFADSPRLTPNAMSRYVVEAGRLYAV